MFVIANEEQRLLSTPTEQKVSTEIIDIHEELQLPEFCNDGRYLKIWFVDGLMRTTATQREDSDSLFTRRIRFLLESEPVLHAADYRRNLGNWRIITGATIARRPA